MVLSTNHLQKRYGIFISSTFEDLKVERTKLARSLYGQEYIVEGMELFPASDESQWDIIREKIADADIYVLIIGDKNGSEAPATLEPHLLIDGKTISYTWLEFRYAHKLDKPILAFIKEGKRSDVKVQEFIAEVQNSGRTTKTWKNPGDLVDKVKDGLSRKIKDEKFIAYNGWIRASDICVPENLGDKSVFLESKTQYIKLISYSEKSKDRKPLYNKYIPRVKEHVDVWDEYVMLTVNSLSHFVNHFVHYNTTQGDAVDLTNIFPFINKLDFTDENAAKSLRDFHPDIKLPSNVYVHASSFYNGFQNGNMDLAGKALKTTATLRLIIDFTSIPNFENIFTLLQCVLVNPDKSVTDITGDVMSIQKGIYLVEKKDVGEDGIIKYKFALQNKPKYVFGYGSLINLASASRTLGKELSQKDIRPARLQDYEREWSYKAAVQSTDMGKAVNGVFLNIKKSEEKTTNGVLFKVTEEELFKLIKREKSYELIDVTASIRLTGEESLEAGARIYAFACTDKNYLAALNSDCFIMKEYCKLVENGCKEISDDFCAEYLRSCPESKFNLMDGEYTIR